MSLARVVVTAVTVEGLTKAEVARDYGVSRQWVHQLVRRYEAEGEAGLESRSRRPRSSPTRIPTALEDEIVEVRKALADEGLDAGAHTIAVHLQRRHGCSPSVATIWRCLSRRGFVTPQPQKRPRSSFIRFEAQMPNERWQADITHWKLANDVVANFHGAAGAQGFPASLLTDNGAVFTAALRGGHCALELECDRFGIRDVHSRPYHPQTCGKVERFHQTLKKWLAKQTRVRTVGELQAQLDRFRDYYNTVRPHRAIGRRTPADAFAARPKATPSGPEIAPPFRLRRDRIDAGGAVTLRHDSRLHHINVGRRYAGRRVLMLVAGLDVRILSDDGELLRALTLDPTKSYQALGGR